MCTVHTPMAHGHIGDGCKFSKAVSSAHCITGVLFMGYLRVLSACTTCATEDNMMDCKCDNGIPVYSMLVM